jgi:hypothetical protein
VAGDIWAAWNHGPSAIMVAQPGRADTEWNSRQGGASGRNAAFHPGFGIFAKAHKVARVGRHVSLRFVPKNQERWLAAYPDVFNNVDDHGRHFASLGAGPQEESVDTDARCDGTLLLTSNLNRTHDVSDQPTWLEHLSYTPGNEDGLIERLLGLDMRYADNLPYCFAPILNSESYNSNSFISGLLRAAAVRVPVTPGIYPFFFPGWLKPVPVNAFGPVN